jgi:hypothetical protein
VNNTPAAVEEVDGNVAEPVAAAIEAEPEPPPVVEAEVVAKPKRARKAPAARKPAAKRVAKKKE